MRAIFYNKTRFLNAKIFTILLVSGYSMQYIRTQTGLAVEVLQNDRGGGRILETLSWSLIWYNNRRLIQE